MGPSLLSSVLSCFSTLFTEAGSRNQTQSMFVNMASLAAGLFWGSPFCLQGWDHRWAITLTIYTGSGDLNLGPQACTTSISPLSHLSIILLSGQHSFSSFVHGLEHSTRMLLALCVDSGTYTNLPCTQLYPPGLWLAPGARWQPAP